MISCGQYPIRGSWAEGSDKAAKRLSRVLRNDPGMGVIRHADAGYELAQKTAEEHHLDLASRVGRGEG